MQHLPILCALKKIPVAVVAATPQMLGSASAPFRRMVMVVRWLLISFFFFLRFQFFLRNRDI